MSERTSEGCEVKMLKFVQGGQEVREEKDFTWRNSFCSMRISS